MSNQFTIQAGLPLHGTAEHAISPRSTAPASAQTTGPPRAPPPPGNAQTSVAKPVALFVNPSFRFDPTTGFVVIEFHNSSGTVSTTIPSQRQLEAYRTHQQTPPGEPAPPTPPREGKTSVG